MKTSVLTEFLQIQFTNCDKTNSVRSVGLILFPNLLQFL